MLCRFMANNSFQQKGAQRPLLSMDAFGILCESPEMPPPSRMPAHARDHGGGILRHIEVTCAESARREGMPRILEDKTGGKSATGAPPTLTSIDCLTCAETLPARNAVLGHAAGVDPYQKGVPAKPIAAASDGHHVAIRMRQHPQGNLLCRSRRGRWGGRALFYRRGSTVRGRRRSGQKRSERRPGLCHASVSGLHFGCS